MDEFEEIAQEAIRRAEAVEGPFSAFVAGLETIVDELSERLAQAREEAGQ